MSNWNNKITRKNKIKMKINGKIVEYLRANGQSNSFNGVLWMLWFKLGESFCIKSDSFMQR